VVGEERRKRMSREVDPDALAFGVEAILRRPRRRLRQRRAHARLVGAEEARLCARTVFRHALGISREYFTRGKRACAIGLDGIESAGFREVFELTPVDCLRIETLGKIIKRFERGLRALRRYGLHGSEPYVPHGAKRVAHSV